MSAQLDGSKVFCYYQSVLNLSFFKVQEAL